MWETRQQQQPLEGLRGKIRQIDEFGVRVETLFITERVRVTIGAGGEDGTMLFVLSVGDSREVMTAAEIRAMAAALRGLAEAR